MSLYALKMFLIKLENTWWSSLFLNFTFCVINSEAGIVPSLFLIFDDFEPRCSYKIVLIKKECTRISCTCFRGWWLRHPDCDWMRAWNWIRYEFQHHTTTSINIYMKYMNTLLSKKHSHEIYEHSFGQEVKASSSYSDATNNTPSLVFL